MQTNITDEMLLINKAAKGDSWAFEQLVNKYEARLYSVALRMCGNREDAQDCLQDAMLRIYRSLDRFKGQSAFSTWAYRITMNTCLDELRRRRSRAATSLDALLETGWDPAAETVTPEDAAISAEQRRELEAAIANLPEDMRSAIILREMHDMTYEEISEALDTNIGTVKSRISRGRERLRQLINGRPGLFGNDE